MSGAWLASLVQQRLKASLRSGLRGEADPARRTGPPRGRDGSEPSTGRAGAGQAP